MHAHCKSNFQEIQNNIKVNEKTFIILRELTSFKGHRCFLTNQHLFLSGSCGHRSVRERETLVKGRGSCNCWFISAFSLINCGCHTGYSSSAMLNTFCQTFLYIFTPDYCLRIIYSKRGILQKCSNSQSHSTESECSYLYTLGHPAPGDSALDGRAVLEHCYAPCCEETLSGEVGSREKLPRPGPLS